MTSDVKKLKARLKKAKNRVIRETDIIKLATDRKLYWKGQEKLLKEQLQLAIEGQLEFPF